MRHLVSALLATATALAAVPATAQDAPASPFTITGGATLTSDYRFRGISQTDKRFAVQGTGTISHSSGLYASFWGSSIDDYVENGADAELDLIAGYKKTFNGTTIDGGMLYYYYPGSGRYDGGREVKSDFFEPYVNVSHAFGPVGVKVGGNFAWKQHGLGFPNDGTDRRGGIYTFGELSLAVPNAGFTVTGHIGHSFQRNFITAFDHYTDWSVTAAYTWKALTFSAAYVDTNRDFFSNLGNVLPRIRDRDVSKAGFVGAVAFAF